MAQIAQLGEDKKFTRSFLYDGLRTNIDIKFNDDKKAIPFQCWVTRELRDYFEWFYLNIKLNIEECSGVKINLNHPTNPNGLKKNMAENAKEFISQFIPILMERDKDKIRKYLNTPLTF